MSMNKTEKTIGVVVGLIAIATFLMEIAWWVDGRYAHAVDTVIRIAMSESTRYAQINKFYADKVKNNEPLTAADMSRWELVQREQERINRAVIPDDDNGQ